MSLVNYYSSSEDENSNGEDETEDSVKAAAEVHSVHRGHQSDTQKMSVSSAEPTSTTSNSKSTLFSSLPAPKLLQTNQSGGINTPS